MKPSFLAVIVLFIVTAFAEAQTPYYQGKTIRIVTGYPAGGTPPVGHHQRFPVVVDTRVADQDWGYAGGGRKELLVRIKSADIVRLTNAKVADVVKE